MHISFRDNFLTEIARLERNLKEDREKTEKTEKKTEKTRHFGSTSRKLCFSKELL